MDQMVKPQNKGGIIAYFFLTFFSCLTALAITSLANLLTPYRSWGLGALMPYFVISFIQMGLATVATLGIVSIFTRLSKKDDLFSVNKNFIILIPLFLNGIAGFSLTILPIELLELTDWQGQLADRYFYNNLTITVVDEKIIPNPTGDYWPSHQYYATLQVENNTGSPIEQPEFILGEFAQWEDQRRLIYSNNLIGKTQTASIPAGNSEIVVNINLLQYQNVKKPLYLILWKWNVSHKYKYIAVGHNINQQIQNIYEHPAPTATEETITPDDPKPSMNLDVVEEKIIPNPPSIHTPSGYRYYATLRAENNTGSPISNPQFFIGTWEGTGEPSFVMDGYHIFGKTSQEQKSETSPVIPTGISTVVIDIYIMPCAEMDLTKPLYIVYTSANFKYSSAVDYDLTQQLKGFGCGSNQQIQNVYENPNPIAAGEIVTPDNTKPSMSLELVEEEIIPNPPGIHTPLGYRYYATLRADNNTGSPISNPQFSFGTTNYMGNYQIVEQSSQEPKSETSPIIPTGVSTVVVDIYIMHCSEMDFTKPLLFFYAQGDFYFIQRVNTNIIEQLQKIGCGSGH